MGFLMSLNTVILVKRLNREKFCPDATSFLSTGSSVYIAEIGTFGVTREDPPERVTTTQFSVVG